MRRRPDGAGGCGGGGGRAARRRGGDGGARRRRRRGGGGGGGGGTAGGGGWGHRRRWDRRWNRRWNRRSATAALKAGAIIAGDGRRHASIFTFSGRRSHRWPRRQSTRAQKYTQQRKHFHWPQQVLREKTQNNNNNNNNNNNQGSLQSTAMITRPSGACWNKRKHDKIETRSSLDGTLWRGLTHALGVYRNDRCSVTLRLISSSLDWPIRGSRSAVPRQRSRRRRKKKQTRTRPWPKRIHYLHETAFESDDSINSIFHEIARVDCQLGRDTEAEWWRFACVYVGVFFHSLFFSILWQFCLSWIQSLGWHEPLGTATDLTTCLPQHVQRTASSVPFSLGLSFFLSVEFLVVKRGRRPKGNQVVSPSSFRLRTIVGTEML